MDIILYYGSVLHSTKNDRRILKCGSINNICYCKQLHNKTTFSLTLVTSVSSPRWSSPYEYFNLCA